MARKRKYDTESSSSESEDSSSDDDSSSSGSYEDEEEKVYIETILAQRKQKKGSSIFEYLVKEKESSYLHIKWMTEKQILEEFTNGKNQMAKFLQDPQEFSKMEDAFDQNCCTIDRIIDHEGSGKSSSYLVKWKSLPYCESTWETYEDLTKVDGLRHIKEYQNRNSPEALKSFQQIIPRPNYTNTKPSNIPLPKFKGGNTLKDYQEEGFRWIAHCWHAKRSSILADEMG